MRMMVILFCVYDSLKHRRFFVISIVFFRKSIYNNGIECKIPDHDGQTKKGRVRPSFLLCYGPSNLRKRMVQ